MKMENDKIIFKNRSEINDVIKALDTYKKENESANKLADLLDIMYLNW